MAKYLVLILKNVRRNLLRSALTGLGTMVLVFVVTLVWSVLWFLDKETTQRSENFKAIVTEKWSMPSRMPYSYAVPLSEGAANKPGDVRPMDSMTWQFFAGTTEPGKGSRENTMFVIATDPDKVMSMLDGMESLPPDQEKEMAAIVERVKANKHGIVLGRNQLKAMNKQIGERLNLYGISNFKGIDFEFEIVGVFPPGRYDGLAAMHFEYFNAQFDAYQRRNNGRKHALADRTLNIVWLKLPDSETYNRVAAQIDARFGNASPAVKVETQSSGVGAFMEAFRDLLWGMRYLLAPACMVTLALVIANAISISVRERQMEFAVMKVLGFRPVQILTLVVGESLLLGAVSGLLSAGLTYTAINWGMGGLKFPIAFFDAFFIPTAAVFWGPAIGAGAALAGSFLPAWTARNVKAAEVFAKVA